MLLLLCFIVLIHLEESIIEELQNDSIHLIQYICINDELDVDHQSQRINIQIIFQKDVDKYRPFLDRYTCTKNVSIDTRENKTKSILNFEKIFSETLFLSIGKR